MIDIAAQLAAIHREADSDAETVRMLVRRHYPAEPADVWAAITDPERVRRWFLPLTGDLRAGGSFRLEGNAGGDILDCAPPSLLRVTFGGPTSLVEVRLAAEGDGTSLELEHAVPVAMAGSVAGALFVGPGWDGALLGVGLYLAGEVADDPAAAASSPEAQRFSARSIERWVAVVEATGKATGEQVETGRAIAVAQFAPDLVAGG